MLSGCASAAAATIEENNYDERGAHCTHILCSALRSKGHRQVAFSLVRGESAAQSMQKSPVAAFHSLCHLTFGWNCAATEESSRSLTFFLFSASAHT
jgi:hypothetical protein